MAERRMPESRRRDSRGRYMSGAYDTYGRARGYGGFGREEQRYYRDPMDGNWRDPMDEDYGEEMYNRRGRRMMNTIGFGDEGEMSRYPGQSYEDEKLTKKEAKQWVASMIDQDGHRGGHWTFEQTSSVLKQRDLDCEPAEFYAILNALYSDYSKVAKKHGVDGTEFWADMAEAWLDDDDACENKAAMYYDCIVEK